MTTSAVLAHRDPRTAEIISAAIDVHRHLGPGLLESAYEACLVHELRQRGLAVAQQVMLPVVYKGLRIELGYRLDLVVAESVIVEVKAVDKVHSLVHAQVLTYLKLAEMHTALICNFKVPLMKDGITRLVL